MVAVTHCMSGCRIASSMGRESTSLERLFSAPNYFGSIAERMDLDPLPGIRDHGFEIRLLRRPAELFLDLAARGDQHRRVPGSSGGFFGLDPLSGYLPSAS